MDLSKLPRLSKTDQPPSASQPEQSPRVAYVDSQYVTPGGPEAWISFAMGALLLLLNHRFLEYLASPATFVANNPVTDAQRGSIKYPESYLFWSDLAVSAFAIVLMLDAIILLKARRRLLIAAALSLTVLTVGGNLAYMLWSYSAQGPAIMSAIAIAYGVYIAIFQWRLLRMLRGRGKAEGGI